LQGMMIDERRATLFQARVAAKMNDNDRQILMNDLLNDAAKAYWEWYFAARQITIFEQAVTLSKVRLEGLKESFRRGDKPAVDTLEAFIQYQERLFDLNDAQLSLQNETLRLNNFLWSAEQRPMQLAKNTMPATLVSNVDLPQNDAQWLESHQLLLQYEYKLNQLDIERRLKREKLKPKLNVDYNLLGNGTDFLANALLQNYRYGVSFSFPILLRQERGNLQLTDLKITSTTLQLQNKRLELQNKINNYRNDFEINQKQITLFQSVLKSYENLLAAENQKFNLGESSVFLVNARERKLIETVVKLLKLEVQQQKNYYGFLGVAGQLR
jgi:outer membrane protein TolC